MNHVSIFDPPLAGSFWPGMLEIIGAIDVFDKPFQGQLLRAYGVIPVHRGDYDCPLLTQLVRILEAGYPILISPEGSRSHIPGFKPARQGVAYPVEKTSVPVVPVALVGTTEDFWQRAKRGANGLRSRSGLENRSCSLRSQVRELKGMRRGKTTPTSSCVI